MGQQEAYLSECFMWAWELKINDDIGMHIATYSGDKFMRNVPLNSFH